MKIKRRDYLLQMGAGTAGLLAAAESPLFGVQAAAQRVKTRGLRWQVTNEAPSREAYFTFIYCGLAQFAYHANGFVEVAFHHGNGKHKLEIQIYKNPVYPTCPLVKTIPVDTNASLTLKLEGQRDPNPKVFQVDCNPFDRYYNATTNPRYKDDFRWLPDLHSHDFYPDGYELNNVTGPRLSVHTGTFYTRTRSNSTFKIVDATPIFGDCEDEVYDFGYIALHMATAVNVRNVLLLDASENPVYPFEANTNYQIVFNNECKDCAHEAEDCDEKKRNDFHFNRKVCKVPLTTRKYGLRLKRACPTERDCAEPDFCLSTHRGKKASDEAPCSGAGYGKAPGIP